MKTISVTVSEPVYQDFVAYAEHTDCDVADLVREAMGHFHQERIRPPTSVANRKPLDLGKPLQPLRRRVQSHGGDDLLDEMLTNK